jgi:hypothetical protein
MTKKGFLKGALAVAAGVAIAAIAVFVPYALLGAAGALLGQALLLSVAVKVILPLDSKLKFRADNKAYPTMAGVPLTKGEASFVESIFGKKIKTGRIRKYFSEKEREGVAAATIDARRIKFYSHEHHSNDYSRSDDIYNYGAFIHEITHTLQIRNSLRMVFNRIFRTGAYEYELSPTSRFGKFGIEQQASITEDYARQFLYQGSQDKGAKGDEYKLSHSDTYQKQAFLKKVVEDKFPEARKTRLALEAQKKTPQPSL